MDLNTKVWLTFHYYIYIFLSRNLNALKPRLKPSISNYCLVQPAPISFLIEFQTFSFDLLE